MTRGGATSPPESTIMKKKTAYGVHPADGSTHKDSAGNLIHKGKVPCCVYKCSVPREANFTDEMVRKLFPKAYGRTVTADHITHGAERSSWPMLLNFRRQSTQDDIKDRITEALGWPHGDERVDVSAWMGVPEQGFCNTRGSSRDGIVREHDTSKGESFAVTKVV